MLLVLGGNVHLAACEAGTAGSARLARRNSPSEQWRPRFSFGVFDAPKSHTLGNVRHVAFDMLGRLIILDDHGPRIIVLGQQGKPQIQIDAHGNGPGDLADPVSVIPVGSAELAVLSRANALLQVFEVDGHSASEVERFQLPFRPSNGCSIGDRFFLLGFYNERLLHEVDRRTGRIIASFQSSSIADSLDEANPLKLTRMAEAADGHLYCSETPPRILHAPESIGRIRSYRPDGALVWQSSLAEFVEHVRTLAVNQSGIRFDVNPEIGYANRVGRLTSVGAELVVVRVEYDWPRNSENSRLAVSVFLDMENGDELGRVADDFAILDAGGRFAATLAEAPFPILRVWERR